MQCPDPHFKKRHQKRRVVQKPLVNSILQNLKPGGKVSVLLTAYQHYWFFYSLNLTIYIFFVTGCAQIFVQSDVLDVAQDMRDQLDEESNVLQHMDTVDTEDGWLTENPMGIRTEREIHAEFEGARIYRRLYQKRQLLPETWPITYSDQWTLSNSVWFGFYFLIMLNRTVPTSCFIFRSFDFRLCKSHVTLKW